MFNSTVECANYIFFCRACVNCLIKRLLGNIVKIATADGLTSCARSAY